MGRLVSKIKNLEDHCQLARGFQNHFKKDRFEIKNEFKNLKSEINIMKKDI